MERTYHNNGLKTHDFYLKDRMAKHFRGALICILIAIYLFLFVNLPQILSLLIWPFSKKLFREVNRKIVENFWKCCLFFTEKVNKTEVIITGQMPPRERMAIVVANHQSMMDIVMLAHVAL